MKKVLLIASILTVAVISTACINNLAVQDLNNKAQAYAEKGDYTQAIERLKSSIDLDPSVFETHYNLAIVYTKSGDYINAIEEYKTVISMKPEMADSYYSLATAENNLAIEMERGNYKLNQEGSLTAALSDEEREAEMTEDEKTLMKELYDSAIKNYEKYLELNPDAEDKSEVNETIERIKKYQNPPEEEDAEEVLLKN